MENSGEDYLLESGILLVTINYRLGPFGFLALPGTNIQVHTLHKHNVPIILKITNMTISIYLNGCKNTDVCWQYPSIKLPISIIINY